MGTGRISLHAGKTQIWNKSGRCPPGCEGIFEAARVADPNAVVWKGDQTLPTDQQGVVVLGAPLGHHTSLPENCRPRQRSTQFCSAGFLLCRISSVRGFCFCFMLPRGPTISYWVSLWHLGGLGLRSAIRSQTAAYWASWADSLPRIRERHPRIADLVGVALFGGRFPDGSNLQAAATCRERLVDVGFDAPEWGDVARGQRPGRSPENRDLTEPRFGWQCLGALTSRGHFSRVPSGPSFHRRTEPSSGPSVVHLLASRSLAHQWWSSRVWNIRSSGFCSFVVFGAPSLSLLTSAGAAATTGQLVGGQGCWDVGGFPLESAAARVC